MLIENKTPSDPPIEHTRYKSTCCHFHCKPFFSWTAIIIAALVGIGISFLLNVFGIAIGLGAFTHSTNGLFSLAIGGFLGMLVTGIVSMFVMGWVAGFFTKSVSLNPHYGVAYGFGAWCLSLVLSIMLAGHVANFMMVQPTLAGQNFAMVAAQTQNQTMQAVAEKTNLNPPATPAQMASDVEIQAHNLSLSLYITFIIFFVGALSSCFGGYFGYKARLKRLTVQERL